MGDRSDSNSVPSNGVPVSGGSVGVLSDDDLADLALGAAPHDPFDVDATPFGSDISAGAPLLPEWYMPVPQSSASSRTPRRTFTVGLIIAALIAVNGAGLCVTYGIPEIAW